MLSDELKMSSSPSKSSTDIAIVNDFDRNHVPLSDLVAGETTWHSV
jgi:hypothetical protein